MTFRPRSLPIRGDDQSALSDALQRVYDWIIGIDPAFKGPMHIARAYTVTTLPDATRLTGGVVFVSNESGGAVLAFSDGVNWRRVTDRAIVT